MMRALSVRQPWAWAILHAGKNIENRTWRITAPVPGRAARTDYPPAADRATLPTCGGGGPR